MNFHYQLVYIYISPSPRVVTWYLESKIDSDCRGKWQHPSNTVGLFFTVSGLEDKPPKLPTPISTVDPSKFRQQIEVLNIAVVCPYIYSTYVAIIP